MEEGHQGHSLAGHRGAVARSRWTANGPRLSPRTLFALMEYSSPGGGGSAGSCFHNDSTHATVKPSRRPSHRHNVIHAITRSRKRIPC
jgi:hypothetical protein